MKFMAENDLGNETKPDNPCLSFLQYHPKHEAPRLKRLGSMIGIIIMRPKKFLFPSFRSRIWSGIDSGGESRKSLKPLDPPVKPGDDGCVFGSPGPAFAMAMDGRASRGMTIL
jgi:hypothetical protein